MPGVGRAARGLYCEKHRRGIIEGENLDAWDSGRRIEDMVAGTMGGDAASL